MNEKTLRIAVPRAWTNDEKGAFLENLARKLLRKQSFEVSERIRFTGMEIDILAVHRPSGDHVYIECKFQDRPVSANVIDLIVGQSFRRNIQRVALFSASPLSKDAAGAIQELRQNDRISFSFYGPDDLLTALVEANVVPEPPSPLPPSISHASVFIHPDYDFLWLFQEQREGRPQRILVSGSPTSVLDCDAIRNVLNEHEILVGLPITRLFPERESAPLVADSEDRIVPREEVSRINTADNLIDYRPCRPADFVGRTKLQKEIWDFLGRVREKATETRLLALVGPSGYGKSSLVAKLAERFRNKKWRTKYFLYPVDVRSARGPMFAAQALLTAIQTAADSGFVDLTDDLQVEDADNLLAGQSMHHILRHLENRHKVLLLFFDQFEEAFTKDELFPVFRSFRRFALDVNARRSNLVLGFSWRTGVSLSDDNPAYQLWNELRDHRITKTLGIFDSAESSRVISQFEEQLEQALLPPLRRRLHEQGQGLPWLLKKLCIHIYNQMIEGTSQVDLIGSRLNVQSLFDEDLEPLSEAQLTSLRHIANNAPVDSLEVYDQFGAVVVNELVEKRLVVRAGQRLAVYWDIFRDYLAEGKVPYIPWTYIPNCTLRMALSACQLLEVKGSLSARELADLLSYSERTIINIISDLQNLAICGKVEDGRYCLLDVLTVAGVPKRVRSQFSEHVVYQHLLKVFGEGGLLSREEGAEVVRHLYSSASVKTSTRDNYFARLVPWLEFSGLVESHGTRIRVLPPVEWGAGFGRALARAGKRGSVFLGAATPEATVALLSELLTAAPLSREVIYSQHYRNAAADLVVLGLARWVEQGLVPQLDADSDRGRSAEEILRGAVQTSPTIREFRELVARNQGETRASLGVRLGESLQRNWKRSSALRYANGMSRYLEFCTEENVADS